MLKISNVFVFILLLIIIRHPIQSQNPRGEKTDYGCGTKPKSENERQDYKHIGNNNYLISVLRNDFDIPEDYFNNLDERGNYKGKQMRPNDIRKPSRGSNANGRVEAGGATTYYIPIKIWNYRNSAGDTAMSNADLRDRLEETFRIFRLNGSGLEFYVKHIAYPVNNDYFNVSESKWNNMLNDYKDNNALNVHISNHTWAAGSANFGKPELSIDVASSINTLAHEIGHSLGLEHTHKGRWWTCTENNGDCGNCYQEPVSRTMVQPVGCGNFTGKKKCEVNGDEICDTAGEPDLDQNVGSNCIYDFTDPTDNWGVTWNPNETNVMSNSRRACRQHFTLGQIGVMIDRLSSSAWDFESTSAINQISGPSGVLCPNQSFSFSTPAVTGIDWYQWEIPHGWTMIGQGNNQITVTTPSTTTGANKIYVNHIGHSGQSQGLSIEAYSATLIQGNKLAMAGNKSVAPGSTQSYSTTPYSYITNYTWTAPSGWTLIEGQGTTNVFYQITSSASSGTVKVVATTSCNINLSASKSVTVEVGGPELRVASGSVAMTPNPVVDQLQITGSDEIQQLAIYELGSGKLLMNFECIKNGDHLDLSNLQRGIYLVVSNVNGKVESQKIIKQ